MLIVVPWLEGGGGQGALIGILNRLDDCDVELVVLFTGNRNHGAVQSLVHRYIELQLPRSPLGVWRAGRVIRKHVETASRVYSLMRASHLVLGLASTRLLKDRVFVATFHQLPSTDARGVIGIVENFFVRRAVSQAQLVTSPSQRAVEELVNLDMGPPEAILVEPNIITVVDRVPKPTRSGTLDEVRLVFAGRFSDQKGLDRIPDLFAGVTCRVHLKLVGDGEKKDLVSKISGRLNPRHSIEILPYSSDVVDYLDWSDAVFMPSRWELNPLLIWEGWSRGRPTFGSRIPVFDDLARAGPMRLFSDTVELDVALKCLATDDQQRATDHTAAISTSKRAQGASHIVSTLVG